MDQNDDVSENIVKIAELAHELGWGIGILGSEDQEKIAGIMIGSQDFLIDIAEALGERIEVYEKGEPESGDDDSGQTFH